MTVGLHVVIVDSDEDRRRTIEAIVCAAMPGAEISTCNAEAFDGTVDEVANQLRYIRPGVLVTRYEDFPTPAVVANVFRTLPGARCIVLCSKRRKDEATRRFSRYTEGGKTTLPTSESELRTILLGLA